MVKKEKKAKKSPKPATPKAAPKQPASNGRKAASDKRARIGAELASEIDTLRGSLLEMVNGYKLKLDAELVQLSMAARGESDPHGKAKLLSTATAEKMLQRLRELEIKPSKGRAKDFQRLQAAVGDLIEEIPPAK